MLQSHQFFFILIDKWQLVISILYIWNCIKILICTESGNSALEWIYVTKKKQVVPWAMDLQTVRYILMAAISCNSGH